MLRIVFQSLRRIIAFLPAAYSRRFSIAVFLMALNSLLELLSLGVFIPLIPIFLEPEKVSANPWVIKYFGDIGDLGGQFLWVGLGIILTLYLVKNLAGIFINWYQTRLAIDLFRYISTGWHQYFFHQGLLYIKKRPSTQIVRDTSTVPSLFASYFVLPLLSVIHEVVVLAVLAALIAWYDYRALLLVVILLVPPFTIFYSRVKNKIKNYQERISMLLADSHQTLYETIFGYVDIRLSGAEDRVFKAFHDQVSETGRLMEKEKVYLLIPTRLLEMAFILGACALIAYSVLFMPDATSRITLMGVFVLAAYRTLPSINRISMAVLNVRGYHYTLEVAEKMEKARKEFRPESRSSKITFQRGIKLENAEFRYPEAEFHTISDVTLEIPKGQVVGLVGSSGSGKSTLLNILLGMLPLDSGTLRVDDFEVSEADLPQWHKHVGYVPQEIFLIDGTIRQNVDLLGGNKGDEERMRQVLKQASLEELVSGLSKGLDAQVGERGANLSIGQRQRLGIARALYSGAEFLIFDEATSALDSKTEEEITSAIQSLKANGVTMLIVAHRHSTLRYCDVIYELSSGKLKKLSNGEMDAFLRANG